MYSKQIGRVVAAAAVTVMTAGTAAAGGFQIPETGTRRTGMGAVVGRPDDGSAVFHNPAGITMMDGVHFFAHAGAAIISTEFNIRPWDLRDDGTYGSDEYLGVEAGADGYYDTVKPSRAFGVIPMMVGSAQITKKLYAAVSVYVGNATGAAFNEADVTRYHLIDGYVIAPQANLTVAYKVTPRLALGASIGVMNIRVKGKRNFYPRVVLSPGADPIDIDQVFGTGTNPLFTLDGEAWAPAWNAGLLATPSHNLSFGIAVTGKVETKYEGDIALISSSDPENNSMYGTHKTTQYLPLTLAAGVNFDATPQLELGIESRFWYYKPYKEQVTEIRGFIINELRTQKNFRNSIQVAGGARLHNLKSLPGLEIMLGAHYDRTPAPAQTLTLDQPSFSHPGLHSGIRYVRGQHRLGLTYTRYWYDVPTVNDSTTFPPLNFTGDGVSNIVSLSYEGTFGDGPLLGGGK